MTDSSNPSSDYQVVARAYRPKRFEELVGQSQISTALGNAIEQSRIGHAYLFTGARGVGKTSAARIFAKCLNCHAGPAIVPCDDCDICQGIASGDDVDVLEIDGASNRGIEEIRQLRANVNVRPSRARFKIYIIDEVHMLTMQAFNALLKTLEEPPAHVKFIFCTTDPEKIPITVLSRCQRMDFLPISTDLIQNRLREIVEHQGKTADADALELLARRAGGSMRDSQSLLEQLLSFCPENISLADVHALLGTADNSAVIAIANSVIERDAAAALAQVEQAIAQGVDAGQLTEQLLGLFRDVMAVNVGCGSELLLHFTGSEQESLRALSDQIGLETTLAMLQTLDQTLTRMRQSTYTRTLLETAIVRISNIGNLDQIPELIRQLQSGGALQTTAVSSPATNKPEASPAKPPPAKPKSSSTQTTSQSTPPAPKKNGPVATDVAPQIRPMEWTDNNLEQVWAHVLNFLGDMTAEVASNYQSLDLRSPDQLMVQLGSSYDRDICQRPERKARLQNLFEQATGKKIRIEFVVDEAAPQDPVAKPVQMSKRQRIRSVEQDQFVRSAVELFDAEITDVRPPGSNS